jgi:hypothetical protein
MSPFVRRGDIIKSEKSTFVFKSPENKNHADKNYYQINK